MPKGDGSGGCGSQVVVDLTAIQSVDQRHRGIPRYVADLAGAVEDTDPGAVGTYAVNPDLALPDLAVSERLIGAGKLRRVDEVDWSRAGLLHVSSPMEMSVPLHRLLPPAARAAGVPWAVTFYDLIPHLMPDYYLEDPGLRRRYRARLQLVRLAAAVLTLSQASRADLVGHLGLDPERVFVVGAGTSGRFVPPASRAAAAAAAAAAVAGLRAPYVFYIGSYEKRKNLEPLLEAWALLPEALRGRWQLVLCCPLRPLERNHLLHRAAHLGIGESVCLTGFVDDDVLLTLHQGADLFVFPSLYEGYGLPVAEALACGAPVLAAGASSLPEILPPEALFDATSPPPIAAAIERGLTDAAFRERLLGLSGRAPSTWHDVAAATLDVYRRVLAAGGPERTSTTSRGLVRVAVAAPLPPDGGEGGAWNIAFLEALAAYGDVAVTAFADRSPDHGRERRSLAGPKGVTVHPLAALEAVEGLRSPFDAVVSVVADDACHTGTLASLRRRRDSVVVARSVTLGSLYGPAARTGALAGGLAGVIRSSYGDAVAPGTGAGERLSPDEARRLGLLFIGDVAARCRTLFVTSTADAALADLDTAAADRAKIRLTGAEPAAAARSVRDLVLSR